MLACVCSVCVRQGEMCIGECVGPCTYGCLAQLASLGESKKKKKMHDDKDT